MDIIYYNFDILKDSFKKKVKKTVYFKYKYKAMLMEIKTFIFIEQSLLITFDKINFLIRLSLSIFNKNDNKCNYK